MCGFEKGVWEGGEKGRSWIFPPLFYHSPAPPSHPTIPPFSPLLSFSLSPPLRGSAAVERGILGVGGQVCYLRGKRGGGLYRRGHCIRVLGGGGGLSRSVSCRGFLVFG